MATRVDLLVFAAELATISWVATGMLTAEWRGHTRSIDARPLPHDLVVFAKPPKYRLVDALPNTSLHPFVEPAPASHSITAAELTRQIFPGYSSPENEQNAG
jgi:hypothetical protein